MPEPGRRSLQEPLRGPPIVIGEAASWKERVLKRVDRGTRQECPSYWPFLDVQHERKAEELGIPHLFWAPTAEDAHRWIGDTCAKMAADMDQRRYVMTHTPETALEELVPIAKILKEVAALAPPEQADQALVLRTLAGELLNDARRGKRGEMVLSEAPTLP